MCKYSPLTTSDLFVSHIVRKLLTEHIYIRLRVAEVGTLVSFGSDESWDEGLFPDKHGSRLVFDDDDGEYWKEALNLTELKEAIQNVYPGELVLEIHDGKEPELFIAAKAEVSVPLEPSNPAKNADSDIDYFFTHKRTIVAVKIAESVYQNGVFVGYMPFRPEFLADALILTDVSGLYTPADHECSGMLKGYQFAVHDIESLDRSTFEVYYLYQDSDLTVYEITNKLL